MSNQRPPDFARLAQLELERQYRERWQLDQAQQAAQQRQKDQDASAQQQQQIEQERIRLEGLQPAYARSDQLFAELFPRLTEWCAEQQRLRNADNASGARLLGLWGSYGHVGKLQALRRAAGLRADHAALPLPTLSNESARTAATALYGIAAGHISAGGSIFFSVHFST